MAEPMVTVPLGTGQKVTVGLSQAQAMANNAASRGYTDVASAIQSAIASQSGNTSSSSGSSTISRSNTSSGGGGTSGAGIPVRSTFEGMGYSVDYAPTTKNITISGNGASTVLTPSMYSASGGMSYLSPTAYANIISSLTPKQVLQQPQQLTYKEMLKQALLEQPRLPELPEYTPYTMQPYQQTTPLIPITSDPSQTVYTPTLSALNAWNQQEQARAQQAYNDYVAQYNRAKSIYDTEVSDYQNRLNILLEAEKARQEYELQEADRLAKQLELMLENQTEAEKLAYERAWQKYVTAGYSALTDEEKQLLGVSAPSLTERNILSQIANRGSIGTSGTRTAGTKTSPTKIRQDYISMVIETRKTPNDAKAQLERDIPYLKSIGLSDYDILLLQDYIDKWNTQYTAGSRTYGRFYSPSK